MIKLGNTYKTRSGDTVTVTGFDLDKIYKFSGKVGNAKLWWDENGYQVSASRPYPNDIILDDEIDSTETQKPEWETTQWGYKSFNSGWELVYINKDNQLVYITDNGDEGFTDNEKIVARICQLHNQSLKKEVETPKSTNSQASGWAKSLNRILTENKGYCLDLDGNLVDEVSGEFILDSAYLKYLDCEKSPVHEAWPDYLFVP